MLKRSTEIVRTEHYCDNEAVKKSDVNMVNLLLEDKLSMYEFEI